ncbi:MAG: ABC transporter ATP-binding protein [Acutalibacteraceae bacterium]|nr:ABC transporter ATP-binding protein [Acutalibacteraceae bacterium]
MLSINNITKKFGEKVALNGLSFNIPDGSVFGLIGSNGSGKSTLLRIISGVYEPDGGSVKIDGKPTFEDPEVKAQCFFISDFPYFYNNSTINNLAALYRSIYPSWDENKFQKLCCMFPINANDRVINMSKGMQRQAALILALSTCPKYLLLDEIFDGLDPVVRQLIKKLLAEMVAEYNATIIIASHNLRELEDVCDHVGLIHSGGIVLEKELDEAKLGIHRIQAVFEKEVGEGLFKDLQVVKIQRQGKLLNLTIKGDGEQIEKYLRSLEPVYLEMLPLTLEEVFISEMEAVGYDIDNILK